MSGHNARSPSQRSFRLSNHGFQPLNAIRDDDNIMANQGNDIPLQTVVSHSPSASGEKDAEKSGMFSGRGRRQLAKIDSRTGAPLPPRVAAGQEKTALNKMGRFYTKVLNFSIVTRYMIYVAPVALLLAIPIILSQTGVIHGSIGNTQQRPFWIWIEISMPASHHALTSERHTDNSFSLAQLLGYEDRVPLPSKRLRISYWRSQPWRQEVRFTIARSRETSVFCFVDGCKPSNVSWCKSYSRYP